MSKTKRNDGMTEQLMERQLPTIYGETDDGIIENNTAFGS